MPTEEELSDAPLLHLDPGRSRRFATAEVPRKVARWVLLVFSLLVVGVWAWPHFAGPVMRDQLSGLVNLNKSPKAEILHLAYKPLGKCLDLQPSRGDDQLLHAVLANCDFTRVLSSQMWIVDREQGAVRNLLHRNKCLAARQFRELAHFGAETCKPLAKGHLWGVTDKGQLATLRGQVAGLQSTYCAVPQPGQLQTDRPLLVLQACISPDTPNDQNQWRGVGSSFGRNILAEQRKRPQKAIQAENKRRQVAEKAGSPLLTARELVDMLGFSSPEHFWWNVKNVFGALSPNWNRWQDILSFKATFADHSDGRAVISSSVIINMLSNMAFAGMNFIKGSNGKDLIFLDEKCHLPLQQYTQQPLECDAANTRKRPDCTFDIPNYFESMEVMPISEYASGWATAPLFGSFKKLYTASKEPSWELQPGQGQIFRMVKEGLDAAKAAGMDPSHLAAEVRPGFRFAFDLEGILASLQEGFYWGTFDQMKYASNGAFGASVIEEKANGDTLGYLLMKSQLAMHLKEENGQLVADLSDLEKYKPIEGFASLGGKATFEWKNGRLRTVELVYNGKVYDRKKDVSNSKFQESILEGWDFAEKAIIASLLAKTQLLIHVKTIHMELAPTLQAVTIEALKGFKEHPLRQFLEPFTTRNIQATNNNLKVWFEFRGGEFGLAPLTVEEQLQLIADDMAKVPLNLAELDMKRFAEARGWTKLGFAPDWYQRALEVQGLFDGLIREWAQGAFEGDDLNLQKDTGVVMWWKSLHEKMPSFQRAAKGTQWLNGDEISKGIDYDVVAEKVAAIDGNNTVPFPDLEPYVPPVEEKPPGYWTTKAPTTSETTTTQTYTGVFRPLSSLNQNPNGFLSPGSVAPQPPQQFKNVYSSIQKFPQDEGSTRDNFFDLKSWLPPQPRRLADQWLGEWASGLNNLALDVGMLKAPAIEAINVSHPVNHLAKDLNSIKDQASKAPNVSRSLAKLAQQMEKLQENASEASNVTRYIGKLAKKMVVLKEDVSKSLDVSDTISRLDKEVKRLKDESHKALDATMELQRLTRFVYQIKDKASGAMNVTDRIQKLANEMGGLKEAAHGDSTVDDSKFSKALDSLQDTPLTSNATKNFKILTQKLVAVEALAKAVASSTTSLASEFDTFQAKSLNAIEVADDISRAAKQIQALQDQSSEALVVTDRINALRERVHALEDNATAVMKVAEDIKNFSRQMSRLKEKAAETMGVTTALHSFADHVDHIQDEAQDVVQVSDAIRTFAGAMDAFQDTRSDAMKASGGIKTLDTQLHQLKDSTLGSVGSSKDVTGKMVTGTINGLTDQMDALKDEFKTAVNVTKNIQNFTQTVDALEEKAANTRKVADGIDHFAKGIDALKAKMWNVTEVLADIDAVSKEIEVLLNSTKRTSKAVQNLAALGKELDTMKEKTHNAVKVTNGITAITDQMQALKEKSASIVNVSKQMGDVTQRMDALKARTTDALNVTSAVKKLFEEMDALKANHSDSEVADGLSQLSGRINQMKYRVEIAALNATRFIKGLASEAEAVKAKVSVANMVTGPDTIGDLAEGLKALKTRVMKGATNVTNGLGRAGAAIDAMQEQTKDSTDVSDSIKTFAKKMEKLQDTASSVNVSGKLDQLSSQMGALQEQAENINAMTNVKNINVLAGQMKTLQGAAVQDIKVAKHLGIVANEIEEMSERPPGIPTQELPNPAMQLGGKPPLLKPVALPPVAPTVPPPPPITPDLASLQMVGMAGPITRTLDEGSEAQDGDEKEEPEMNEEELKQILKELPPLTVVTITKVLRTLFLWTSWIHEDVGHAWASFIYNPIHTPGFVPADGRGIPMPALIYRVAMFRNFVALERNKLVDSISTRMFSTTYCNPNKGPYSWTSCQDEVNGVIANAFSTFQRKLRQLTSKSIFAEVAQQGFYSRVSDVESSASS